MNLELKNISSPEKAAAELAALYNKYGYTTFKMSKFEDYDLYASNREFLVADNFVTFTDMNGKLKALKPDVTLSIIKNSEDAPGVTRKVCYCENVYRVSKGTGLFREITQTGLECFGEVDACCVGEVLMLAAESLNMLSGEFVLDICQSDIVRAAVNGIVPDERTRSLIIRAFGSKNAEEIPEIITRGNAAADGDKIAAVKELACIYGTPGETLGRIRRIALLFGAEKEYETLKNAVAVFKGTRLEKMIRLDFSSVEEGEYYNGIIFHGFLPGVPVRVLSGGCYDMLMRKFGRNSGAAGFAVYIDELERLFPDEDGFDADVLLLYGPDCTPAEVTGKVAELAAEGYSVRLAAGPEALPKDFRYREIRRVNAK